MRMALAFVARQPYLQHKLDNYSGSRGKCAD